MASLWGLDLEALWKGGYVGAFVGFVGNYGGVTGTVRARCKYLSCSRNHFL